MAVVLAPAFVAILSILAEVLIDLIEGRAPIVLVEAYFIFSYLFALIPAALVMLILKKLHLLKLRHFAVAGLAASVICASVFVLVTHPGYATESLTAFVSEFVGISPLLIIGPIVGVCVWVISELGLPSGTS